MQRDKIYGALIFIVALVLLIYLSIGYLTHLVTQAGSVIVPVFTYLRYSVPFLVPHWVFYVILPMWIVVILILGIAMWIGWTMLTTPPPVPLEELEELGLEDEEEEK
ncbi:MAG: hypothetical protein ACTSRW_08295 [Candidatus Helarchaeota archaeon]